MPNKPARKPCTKKLIEHTVQIPLMDGCFLCLQINNMANRWTIGFPKDKAVYPISEETAKVLAHLASGKVRAGWNKRTLSKEELEVLEEFKCLQCAPSKQEPAPIQDNVDRFVTDMVKVWDTSQSQIKEMVSKINELLSAVEFPVMDGIFSLVLTALLASVTIGASGPHVAGLALKIAEQIKMTVESTPIQHTAGLPN